MDAVATTTRPPIDQVCPARAIVCCPGAIPVDPLPWFAIALGIFIACQTMVLGLTVNLSGDDDPRTLAMLRMGMLVATTLVLVLLGMPLARDAAAALRRKTLSMELFFLIGILAAMAISILSLARGEGPVYFEVVNILLVIYSIGQAIHRHSRRKAIAAAEALAAPEAPVRLCKDDKSPRLVPVIEVAAGDCVSVLPGEVIPVDGQIVSGESLVRQTAFTGQQTGVTRRAGDAVWAGEAAEDGTLVIRATAPGRARRLDRLSQLIQAACQSPPASQRLADRFVSLFLPVVLAVALAAGAFWTWRVSWGQGLFAALAVILVACPCAAGLAVPLTLWTLLGDLARRGLVVRSAQAIEDLASADTAVLDKTGTLAQDQLQVQDFIAQPGQRELAMALIDRIERHSRHPVARALRALRAMPAMPAAAPALEQEVQLQHLRTLPARGVEAQVRLGQTPAVAQLIRREGGQDDGLLTIDLILDQQPLASVTLRETLRDSAAEAVRQLGQLGLDVQIMTGSAAAASQHAAAVASMQAGLSPQDKVSGIDALAAAGRRVLYVGDAVNDAAAMARSHVSIAMAHGDEVAALAASATLHGGDLRLIGQAVRLSRQAMARIRSNLLLAAGYNVLGMTAAATGYLHPILAATLMCASSLLIAWRAGRPLTESLPASDVGRAASDPTPAPKVARSEPDNSRSPWRWRAAAAWHAAGLIGQTVLLIPLARLPAAGACVAVGVSILAALALARGLRRLPAWTDHFIARISLGGLGMNLGWWMDLDLSSAVNDDGTVRSCCAIWATLDAARGGSGSFHWMYWGMLLAGVPAMFLLRREAQPFSLRRWCCLGPLLLGTPAMCFGMWAGGQLAERLPLAEAPVHVLVAYLAMMLGMCAGMLLPHAMEAAWAALRRPADSAISPEQG